MWAQQPHDLSIIRWKIIVHKKMIFGLEHREWEKALWNMFVKVSAFSSNAVISCFNMYYSHVCLCLYSPMCMHFSVYYFTSVCGWGVCVCGGGGGGFKPLQFETLLEIYEVLKCSVPKESAARCHWRDVYCQAERNALMAAL